MRPMKWVITAISGLLVLALIGAVSAFTLISNAKAGTEFKAPIMQAFDRGTQPDLHGPAGKERGGENQQLLADVLGIPVEDLQTATDAAMKTAVAQAVEEGLITQAQADAMIEKGFSDRGFGGMLFGMDSEIDMDSLLAKQLGISVEELQAARVKAHNAEIAQAVENGQIMEEQAEMMKIQDLLRDYIRDAQQQAYQSAVAKAVADGVITQAQADLVLSNIAQADGNWMGRPDAMGGRPGRGSGGFDRQGGSPENPTANPNS